MTSTYLGKEELMAAADDGETTSAPTTQQPVGSRQQLQLTARSPAQLSHYTLGCEEPLLA